MVRGKIEIKKIDSLANRQVTFTKRRKGLFKKAEDLSILCGAQLGVIAISSTSKVYDFATNGDMKVLLEDYTKIKDEGKVINSSSEAKLWKLEAESLRLQLEELSKQHRVLLGEEIANLSIQQIENLEKQMEANITAVRASKASMLYKESIEVNGKLNTNHKEMGSILHKVYPENEEEVVERTSIDLNEVYDPFSPLELQLGLPQLNH